MSKFQNKYRIPSTRLQTWDYSANGCYFITICTQNKECYFGKIVPVETLHATSLPSLNATSLPSPNATSLLPPNAKHFLQETPIGMIAIQFWAEIPEHFNNMELGEFVVMPNHVHGIIPIKPVETLHATSLKQTVETLHETSSSNNKIEFMSNISPKPGSLAAVIRSFKSAVTTYARKNHILFDWQPRYYDHIIRKDDEFQRIKDYVINNPDNWVTDKFYK